jgi:hypothetical protein
MDSIQELAKFMESASLKGKVEYRVIVSHSGYDLTDKVNQLISEGWIPIGSHQSVIKHEQNRFRGDQHMDTINDIEYSQTLIRSI